MTQNLSKHGIGASEISAIAGLNPYASPWNVWERKVGNVPEDPGSAAMEWGNRLEPAIRQAYVDQTRHEVMVPGASLFHRELAWARATPDGIVIDRKPNAVGGVWTALLQCKNVGAWVEKSWREAPPVYVQLQTQWEMFVAELARDDVAVLIGGSDFRVYTIHRDDKVIADLVDIATDFWNRVETRTPPKVDDSDACAAHFEKRLAKAQAVELVADKPMNDLMAEWLMLAQRTKHDDKRIQTIRNAVRAELAGAQASSLRSEVGTAKIIQVGGGTKTETRTEWKLIAELLGSTRCAADEWQSLLAANTTTSTRTSDPKPTLYAPREWSREREP